MLIRRPPKRAVLLFRSDEPNEAPEPGLDPCSQAAKCPVVVVTAGRACKGPSSPPRRLPDLVEEEVLLLGGEQRVIKVEGLAELVFGGGQKS
jgi:hypothetical protein